MVIRPSTSWRTIRVFISSTFRDMHGERDHLVKVVFPALRERLQRYRLHLVDIDLRWGVTEEAAESDRALELCLDQVQASRPFFLCMLGERYGYVPERLPRSTMAAHSWLRDWPGRSVTEMEVRAGMRGDSGVDSKPIFFLRDPAFIDDVPATKRGDVQVESVEARTKLDELKQVVCSADVAVSVEHYACTYRGLRVSPRLLKGACLADVAGVLDGVMRDGLVEPAEYAALEPSLQDFVCANAVVYTGGLESFGRSVEDRLWTAIREELALPAEPPEYDGTNALDEEAQYHDAFIESRLRVHVDRTRILRRLLAHATGKRWPLLVLAGPPGSGKSSLMARLVAVLRTRAGNSGRRATQPLVVAHFVGASPHSTNLRQMLRRFCLILDATTSGGDEISPERWPTEVPDTTDELIEAFRARLQSHPPAQRVVFVIDGVNQLDPMDNAHAMHWLPRQLPTHVRVIVSCLEDEASAGPDHHGATTDAVRVLAALRHRPHRRVDVTPLSDVELLEIVRVVPSLSAKTLDGGQIALLLDNPATRNPLFLLVALEELRGFGSFEHLAARIAAFPREGDTLTEIFEQVMARLEEDLGLEVVERCLSYLGSSRFGLSEREIVELVVPADADQSNVERAASLYAVLRQIRAYTQYRGTLVDFFHANFKHAVLERYLASPPVRAENHRSLANYFRGKADPGGTADWAGGSPRALRELPYHLAEAGDGEALRALVLDGAFLHAKLLAFDPHALIDDFNLALGRTEAGSPDFELLTELRDALRLSIRQLARHPAELLTQLKARVNGEVAGVAAALESFASRAGSPWLWVWTRSLTPTGPLLWQTRTAIDRDGGRPSKVTLSSDAARIVVAAAGGIVSIYSADGGLPLVVLEGDRGAGAALDVVVSEDGRTATVLRENGSLESWDLIDQAPRRTKRVNARSSTGEVTAVAFDGTDLMFGTSRGAMKWRRVDDPAFRGKWQGHAASVAAVGFISSAARVVTSHVDGRLMVWDMTAKGVVARDSAVGPAALSFGSENWEYSSFGESYAFALAVSRDGSTAFAGHAEKIYSNLHGNLLSTADIRGFISQVDLATGDVIARLQADAASPVIDLDVTPDGRFCVTLMQDGGVKLWDLRKADLQVPLEQHSESPPTVGITPDGRRVLSASNDGFLIVWELTTGEVRRLRGYRDEVFEIRVSPDSRYALVVSDGFCNVWNLTSLKLGMPLGDSPKSGSEYTVWIRDAVILPSSDRAVTVTGNGVITTWDLQTGRPVGEPYTIVRDVRNASFSTSGRWVLIATDHGLALYDLSRQISVRGFRLSASTIVSRIFPASDGGRFRVELTSGDPLFWDPEEDAPMPRNGDAIRFEAGAVTPDGRYALGYDGTTMTLMDIAANVPVASYTADAGFTSFALSDDGQIMAAGGENKEVHVLVLMPGSPAPR